MTTSAGQMLSHYRLVEKIGQGGMGVVWKAEDTRLARVVAVKVLPEHLAGHAEALDRFAREARLIATLNHPNILSLFDVGHAEDTAFAVMELLVGETLRSRLAQGPLAPRKGLELAIQMADGLAAAHEKGVLHRDLKPENLWITREGRLKILDFGLAKQVATTAAGSDSLRSTATRVPGPQTERGRILGTLDYMSPEQARGEPVDCRTDLFSFGVVLLEMLTGRRAFARDTAGDTMAAILRDDPDPSLLSDGLVPPSLQPVIVHCLEKEPGRRFQTAADLRFALESASVGSGRSVASRETPPIKSRWRPVPVAAVGLVGLLLGGGLMLMLRGSPEPAPVVAIRLVTYSGHDTSPAVSPDGKTVAFTSDRDGRPRIWLKQLPGGGEQALTDGPDDFPRFSPDGTSLLFIHFQEGKTSLHRTSLLGNNPHKVVEDAEQGDWSPDGKQIAFMRLRNPEGRILSTLFTIAAAGGAERELARFEGELAGFPRWSPDGRHIIVNTPPLISSGVLRKFFLVDASDGTAREIRTPGPYGMLSTAVWASADEIIFLRAESITGGGTAVSPARAYRENIRTFRFQPLFWVGGSGTTVDLLPDGRVIFDGMNGRQNLRVLDLEGGRPPR